MSMDKQGRIDRAINYGVGAGGIDGSHHKMWVIDQMLRALTGCPMEPRTVVGVGGSYTYEVQGVSEEYAKLVREACDGEDGPQTYDWDEGIAP